MYTICSSDRTTGNVGVILTPVVRNHETLNDFIPVFSEQHFNLNPDDVLHGRSGTEHPLG